MKEKHAMHAVNGQKRPAYFNLFEVVALLLALLLYVIPFYFVLINSFKTKREAGLMNISWPSSLQIVENYREVITANRYALLVAFKNSVLITAFSLLLMILVCSMAGFILQRRRDKLATISNFVLLTGLMIPPAIVPTIWVMQTIGIYKTLHGMVLIEVALNCSFSCILYRGFMGSIPREIDEAAVIDGCGSWGVYFRIIMPLLRPVTATVIVLSTINIFNDFVNPMYFLPGTRNITVQQTLYNFSGKYTSDYNLLFADVMLITIPPLLLFIFFNRQIVSGMVAGAIKG